MNTCSVESVPTDMMLAVDIGCTKVAAGLVNQTGVMEQLSFPTPLHDGDRLIRLVGEAMCELIDTSGLRIGGDISDAVIGFNGTVTHDKKDKKCIIGPLYGTSVGDETYDLGPWLLEAAPDLEGLQVLGLNDAEAAGFAAVRFIPEDSEAADKPLAYLNHGTGVGGEVYFKDAEGRLVSGRQLGLLVEIGECLLKQSKGLVTLGSITSGEGIANSCGCRAVEMDRDEQWNEIGKELAYGCSGLLSIVGPRAIIIGGGVSRSFTRYEKGFRSGLDEIFHTLSHDSSTQRPEVYRVPPEELDTLPLNGAYLALRASGLNNRSVAIGQAQDISVGG